MSAVGPEAIRDAVARRADDIVGWTQELVRFPSENRPPAGDEGPAQEFIAGACRAQGWEVDLFAPDEVPGVAEHPAWLCGRTYGQGRRNVVARWRGERSGGRRLLLSGHVDVAPYEPDDWKVCRPFAPVVKDGRLYGRGAADMKGGLAAAFWALRVLQDLGFEPAGDLLFESLVDEEFASGNGALAARLRGPRADLAVIGEPTRMEVCPACLGAFLGELTIAGAAGMPYTGAAIPNPLHGAARAIALFRRWQEQWRAQNHHPLFAAPGKELNVLLWRLDTTRRGEFAQMGTPLQATLAWIVWCHPGMTEEEFYLRFRAFWREHGAADPELTPFRLELQPTHHFVQPWETPSDSLGVSATVAAFERYAGRPPAIGGAPFSCDLGLYGEVGPMPCLLLGPRGGNLHAPDEWVETADLLTLTGVYATLAASWCGAAA
ncbi:MAG TPA: M20/M25/M40 family metallo-hydrolase [Armatimonadota bacterium]|nr:M20/M25/M40 family metallo-hydrolase [Armatimonadota bacterium]